MLMSKWSSFSSICPTSFFPSSLKYLLSIHYLTGLTLGVENTKKSEDKREICPYSTLGFTFHSLSQINPSPPPPTTTILLYYTTKSSLSFPVLLTWNTLLATKQHPHRPSEKSTRLIFSANFS